MLSERLHAQQAPLMSRGTVGKCSQSLTGTFRISTRMWKAEAKWNTPAHAITNGAHKIPHMQYSIFFCFRTCESTLSNLQNRLTYSISLCISTNFKESFVTFSQWISLAVLIINFSPFRNWFYWVWWVNYIKFMTNPSWTACAKIWRFDWTLANWTFLPCACAATWLLHFFGASRVSLYLALGLRLLFPVLCAVRVACLSLLFKDCSGPTRNDFSSLLPTCMDVCVHFFHTLVTSNRLRVTRGWVLPVTRRSKPQHPLVVDALQCPWLCVAWQ